MIDWVAVTGSTNDDVLARLADGNAPAEGMWHATRRQTAGRGRGGRQWFDGHGNFMGSTVVQLRRDDPPAHSLALLAAIAIHRTVDGLAAVTGTPADVRIKWPNDILIDGAKCAGLLLERRQDCVVVGVGVNLVQAPEVPGRRTTSLSAHGISATPDAFGSSLAEQFATAIGQWRQGGWPDAIIAAWLQRAHPAGATLRLTDGERAGTEGRFEGLNPDGSLRLRLSDASIIAIHAGDVMIV
ncbi:MAG: biotin--[acetyl-CoA-carboxylase] ligase [Sphingomonadales bacterium]|nr:biotin--[acetyl-CoA-carboxylase] ligase [Sphingomonadales bacterium]